VVGVLAWAESVAILCTRVYGLTGADADQLAKELDGLPQATAPSVLGGRIYSTDLAARQEAQMPEAGSHAGSAVTALDRRPGTRAPTGNLDVRQLRMIGELASQIS
jgi:hypothetical protein